MTDDPSSAAPPPPAPTRSAATGGVLGRIRRALLGAPRDFRDPNVFHSMSLVAFLAWIGLGADGLSSSAYGPDECFKALVEQGEAMHVDFRFLAVFLAIATATTVFVISTAYSRVIEHFPSGGGGYLVATKLLGPQAGVVSGCALLVDYVLTITVSVASGGDALFNMLPLHYHFLKLPSELCMLLVLILLNLRGVKESVTALMPVFMIFVATHVILILGSILTHLGSFGHIATDVSQGFQQHGSQLGGWGLFLVFLSAYSRGAGTYTGIEAVSNGLQIMREPRVQTGKHTMVYMATSLAFTAGGILLCYLLFQLHPAEGKTMNGVLVEAFAGDFRPLGLPVGHVFVILTLASEGMLLFVAAQTGFIDGPRVMANMAVDSWLPHRFASLSDRLTMKDGVLLMGVAAIALLAGTRGNVDALVVMYSINVFVTFSLTMLGMCRLWISYRADHPGWKRNLLIQAVGLVMCVAILAVVVAEKITHGAWVTVVITASAIALCILIRSHYRSITAKLRLLDQEFEQLPGHDHHGGEPDPRSPTAVLLVGRYGGVGIHSILQIHKAFPGYFQNLVFVSVAVIDSGTFKGVTEVDALRAAVEGELGKYVELGKHLGFNSAYRTAVGIDGVEEITRLCVELAQGYPRTVYFAGKLLWKRETWFQRILHNETAYQVQRRLQWKGLPMTVLPLRVADDQGKLGSDGGPAV